MHLDLSEEQELLRESVARLFATESSPERVRAAEPLGFDPKLWTQLAELGVFGLRVPEEDGGGGGSLLDAAIVALEAGRKLVSGPWIESILAARLLSLLGGPHASDLLPSVLDGSKIVTLAPGDLAFDPTPLVPGAAVADAVIAREGKAIVLFSNGARPKHSPANLGSSPLARLQPGVFRRSTIAEGASGLRRFADCIEEWKLLSASALAGLGREALEIAGRYSCERIQFDRPIGAFQGIAHPLAESAAEIEAARVIVWKTLWALSRDDERAPAMVSMSRLWASHAASRAVARALHAHGGYGLSLEYDIQLYHSRAKALSLALGDPRRELRSIADRLWDPETARAAARPEPGEIGLDFGFGESAEALRRTARAFFEEHLDDELRAHAHFAWEGHHPGFQRKLAEAGLLYPSWPREYGGQDRDPYEMRALAEVMDEFGWGYTAIGTTSLAAQSVMKFGSEALKREVLPRIACGDAIVSLGYSEPGSGSDVAAAETRAVRDGEDWVINGQKMFTSGANLAQYVFLLTRTTRSSKKHEGLTMFLVPLETPGIEIQAVHTISDEKTNATYYTDVRVPDHYRVGEIDAGWSVLSYALQLEHGGGYPHEQARLVEGALAWARAKRTQGGTAIEDADVRRRLARAAMHAEVSSALCALALFSGAEGKGNPAVGPMARVLSTTLLKEDASDLLDLCAPDSLLRGPEGGRQRGAAAVEFRYRLAAATAIYGGTTEIMKSIIAQASLGMPRSRS